jgi:hypothetical protein
MAYSVDWIARVVTIPVADLIYVAVGSYQLSMVAFHKEARRLEWEFDEGLWFPQILDRGNSRTLAGVPYAPFDEIINGYTVTFDPTAARVSVVGSNNNIFDVMNINGVSVATANSAGLTDVEVSRLLSYKDEVHVDINSSYSGLDYPTGTEARIVNNIPDALLIAEVNQLSTLVIHSDRDVAQDLSGYRVRGGASGVEIAVTVLAGADCSNTKFSDLIVDGDFAMSVDPVFRECTMGNSTNMSGLLEHCHLPLITLTIGAGKQVTIDSCHSTVPGQAARPFIDMTVGVDTQLVVAGWYGGLEVSNCDTPACKASFNVTAGAVRLMSSCTDGDIAIRGDVDVDDQSAGSAVTNRSTHTTADTARKLLAGKAVISPDDSTSTIYDDDKTTPLVTFDHPDSRTRDPQ